MPPSKSSLNHFFNDDGWTVNWLQNTVAGIKESLLKTIGQSTEDKRIAAETALKNLDKLIRAYQSPENEWLRDMWFQYTALGSKGFKEKYPEYKNIEKYSPFLNLNESNWMQNEWLMSDMATEQFTQRFVPAMTNRDRFLTDLKRKDPRNYDKNKGMMVPEIISDDPNNLINYMDHKKSVDEILDSRIKLVGTIKRYEGMLSYEGDPANARAMQKIEWLKGKLDESINKPETLLDNDYKIEAGRIVNGMNEDQKIRSRWLSSLLNERSYPTKDQYGTEIKRPIPEAMRSVLKKNYHLNKDQVDEIMHHTDWQRIWAETLAYIPETYSYLAEGVGNNEMYNRTEKQNYILEKYVDDYILAPLVKSRKSKKEEDKFKYGAEGKGGAGGSASEKESEKESKKEPEPEAESDENEDKIINITEPISQAEQMFNLFSGATPEQVAQIHEEKSVKEGKSQEEIKFNKTLANSLSSSIKFDRTISSDYGPKTSNRHAIIESLVENAQSHEAWDYDFITDIGRLGIDVSRSGKLLFNGMEPKTDVDTLLHQILPELKDQKQLDVIKGKINAMSAENVKEFNQGVPASVYYKKNPNAEKALFNLYSKIMDTGAPDAKQVFVTEILKDIPENQQNDFLSYIELEKVSDFDREYKTRKSVNEPPKKEIPVTEIKSPVVSDSTIKTGEPVLEGQQTLTGKTIDAPTPMTPEEKAEVETKFKTLEESQKMKTDVPPEITPELPSEIGTDTGPVVKKKTPQEQQKEDEAFDNNEENPFNR